MERRRELRNLALPFIILDCQRPAENGGENACQQQTEGNALSLDVVGY